MAIRDIFKVSRKTFFNPAAWLDIESLRLCTLTIYQYVIGLFTLPKPDRSETFEQAVARLKLSEADIEAAKKNYFIAAMIFLGFGILTAVFAIYLLVDHGSFRGFLLALAVVALLFAQAFRNHFLYFQIKHHKLGCTFEEWRQGKISSDKDAAP